jgi:hypothetical protein
MRLFKMQVERKREGREIVVHAETEEEAIAHAMKRYAGWHVTQCVEIVGEAHFTVAFLEP